MRTHCREWAVTHFPGRDPEVLQSKYQLIIDTFTTFKHMNDVIKKRDDTQSTGDFSETLQRALHDFPGKGKFE
jgi:hypothetical protein